MSRNPLAASRRSPTRRLLVAGLAGVAVVIAVILAGSGDGRDEVRLLFTGETLGRLAPCICEGRLAGGLGFRRGYLATVDEPHLLVDTGNIAKGRGAGERLRAVEIVRAMVAMGYHAANIGEHELVLDRGELDELTGLGLHFVSANVLDDTGEPVVAPFVVSAVGGPAVAITGVVEHDRFLPGAGLRTVPPREALARQLPALRAAAEHVVVLADLPRRGVEQLAAEFPELDCILFRGRQDSQAPMRVNRSWIASVYGGRYIADLRLRWAAGERSEASGEAVVLDDRFAGSSAPATRRPPGVTVRPEQLAFGTFRRGQLHRAQLTVVNANDAPVRVGRVYSPCTCFAMSVREAEVPAHGRTTVDVTLHSLELEGEQSFPLYVEIGGAVRGLLNVTATATVIEPGTETGDTP
ncbi:MAG: hypothetical protein ACOCYP_02760 [Planctomycetota bacterium]